MDLSSLVGLPYRDGGRDASGVDCWGLVFLAYRAAGIEVPSYSDRTVDPADARAIGSLIAGELPAWRPVAAGQERTLDAVLMRDGRALSHVGVVVAPGRLLHVERAFTSRIERYRATPLARRVVSFHRFGQ